MHHFCQGFWVALRLDLLQWFMPLPISGNPAKCEVGASFAGVGEGTAVKSARDLGVAGASTATAFAPITWSGAKTTTVTEPEHVSILSIITSVDASADVRGFALATWRGVENRDGFVLDIERLLLALFGILFSSRFSCVRVRRSRRRLPYVSLRRCSVCQAKYTSLSHYFKL